MPNAELQSASERAKTLWSGRDAATGQIVRSRRNSLLSAYDRTVLGVGSRSGPSSADSTTADAGVEDHGIRCDSCNEVTLIPRRIVYNAHRRVQWIIGVRYQCASCSSLPKAYSLVSILNVSSECLPAWLQCAKCEERSYVVHDPMHVFFKFRLLTPAA